MVPRKLSLQPDIAGPVECYLPLCWNVVGVGRPGTVGIFVTGVTGEDTGTGVGGGGGGGRRGGEKSWGTFQHYFVRMILVRLIRFSACSYSWTLWILVLSNSSKLGLSSAKLSWNWSLHCYTPKITLAWLILVSWYQKILVNIVKCY